MNVTGNAESRFVLKHNLLGVRTKAYTMGVQKSKFHFFSDMYSHKVLISILAIIIISLPAMSNTPVIELSTGQVSCHGKADGLLTIHVSNISAPHTLRIIQQSTRDTSYRNISADAEIALKHLEGGPVLVELIREGKTVLVVKGEIPEPDPFLAGKIEVRKAPSDNASCDGVLAVAPTGGTPPYSYKWSENAGSQTGAVISSVCRGIYRCEINDSKQCGPVYISVPLVHNVLNKTDQ